MTKYEEMSRDELIEELRRKQEELEEARESYRKLYDSGPAGYCVLDYKGVIREINLIGSEMLGREPSSLNNLPFGSFISEDDVNKFFTLLEQSGTSEKRMTAELTLNVNDNFPVYIELLIMPLKDKKNNKLYQITFTDITDSKYMDEELLKTTIDSIPDIIGIQNTDHTIVRYNRKGYEFLNLTPKDVHGRRCYELIGRNEICENCPTEKALKSKKMERIEKYIPEYDVYLDCCTNPVFNKKGDIVLLVEQLRDITERKRAEEALRKSEERFRDIAVSSADWLWEINKEGYYTFCSGRIFDVLGYTVEEILGKTPFDLMDEAEAEHIREIFSELALHRKPLVDMENRVRHKDGREKVLLTRGVPILDKEGNLWGYRGVDRDITDYKLIGKELIRSEKKYRQFIEIANEGVWAIDDRGNTTFVNPKMAEMFGCTVDEMLGKHLFSFMDEKEVDLCRNYLERRKNGIKENHDFVFLRKDGRKIYTIMSVSDITDDNGNYKGAIALVTDITERRQTEEEKNKLREQLRQTQKMEAIGTLAGGIAHDFNNILTAIIGYGELSLDLVQENDLLKNNLYHILNSGKRAKELVRQILTFSRKMEPKLKPVIISSVIKEVVTLLRASLPTTIEIIYSGGDNSIVLADPTQIHQIIMNLGSNAFQAMKERNGILEIKVENILLNREDLNLYSDLKAGPYVKLTVRDTGAGIPPEHIEKIFEPYFTTKEVGEGTGLGLAVILGIVKSYGGDIKVFSEMHKGTKFEILFPKIKTELSFKDKIPASPEGGKERILIVDDEEDLVELLQRILEILGYKVTARNSAMDALDTFKKDPDGFDLLITDLTMPKMTGAELAEELYKIKPGFPVILCTGNDDNLISRKSEKSFVSDYMLKPFTRNVLASKIRNVLDKREIFKDNIL